MPIRELQCDKCEHTYDTLIRNEKDMAEERCPKCGCPELTMKISYPGNYTISGDNSASVRPKKSRSTL